MEDTQAPTRQATGIGSTALGRLHLRVPEDDGFEEVVIERRWPDLVAARAWCERTLDKTEPGTTVLEVQVFEERWEHARSWETTPSRPYAEALQLGVVVDGLVRWSGRREMTARAGARHLI